MGVVHGYIGR